MIKAMCVKLVAIDITQPKPTAHHVLFLFRMRWKMIPIGTRTLGMKTKPQTYSNEKIVKKSINTVAIKTTKLMAV
jgi:hypothetical protein